MSDGGRGKRAFRLSALAFAATCASATMIVWVAFLPGSCSFVGAAAEAETSSASSSFLTNAARFVPKTLITKYRNERGTPRRACVTHVLPSAAWSALALACRGTTQLTSKVPSTEPSRSRRML